MTSAATKPAPLDDTMLKTLEQIRQEIIDISSPLSKQPRHSPEEQEKLSTMEAQLKAVTLLETLYEKAAVKETLPELKKKAGQEAIADAAAKCKKWGDGKCRGKLMLEDPVGENHIAKVNDAMGRRRFIAIFGRTTIATGIGGTFAQYNANPPHNLPKKSDLEQLLEINSRKAELLSSKYAWKPENIELSIGQFDSLGEWEEKIMKRMRGHGEDPMLDMGGELGATGVIAAVGAIGLWLKGRSKGDSHTLADEKPDLEKLTKAIGSIMYEAECRQQKSGAGLG